MSFVTVAVTTAGATLLGGYMQGQAARDAADTQAGAARNATNAQLSMYNQTREDQAPYRQAGYTALGQMQNPDFQKTFSMADFQADPGYAFRMQQGQQALERSAAARGGLMSGGTLKAIDQYSQDLGSQEYQNAYSRFNNDQSTRFNRLASIAGVGQTANNTMAGVGQNTANQIGQNITGAGNAQAAGQIGQANAINNAIGTGSNTWMQYNMMNRMFPQSSPSYGGGFGGGGSSVPDAYAPAGGGYLGNYSFE